LFRQIGLGPIYSENNFTHLRLVTTFRKYTLGWKKKTNIVEEERLWCINYINLCNFFGAKTK
jgi:hypothetical protein